MGTELKPCPFCGCAAAFVKHSAGVPGTQGFDKWDAVACKYCRATVGACDRRFRCRDDAREAWNRRAELPNAGGQRSAFEQWADKNGWFIERNDEGYYCAKEVECMWMGWEACAALIGTAAVGADKQPPEPRELTNEVVERAETWAYFSTPRTGHHTFDYLRCAALLIVDYVRGVE